MVVKIGGQQVGQQDLHHPVDRPQDGFRGYRPRQGPRFRRTADRDRRHRQLRYEARHLLLSRSEFMDEDKIEDIYLYFKEDAESDSLDDGHRGAGRPIIPRRRYAWCALSLCASRATDFRFYRVFSALRLRPGTVLLLQLLLGSEARKPFLRNQKADETGVGLRVPLART